MRLVRTAAQILATVGNEPQPTGGVLCPRCTVAVHLEVGSLLHGRALRNWRGCGHPIPVRGAP